MLFEARITLREMMDIIYAVNATRKIQHIKPLPAKVYQYLKKLDKNLEEAHFKSTLERFVKNDYFVVQRKAEKKSFRTFQTMYSSRQHTLLNNRIRATF